jgi:hypothetical protein
MDNQRKGAKMQRRKDAKTQRRKDAKTQRRKDAKKTIMLFMLLLCDFALVFSYCLCGKRFVLMA